MWVCFSIQTSFSSPQLHTSSASLSIFGWTSLWFRCIYNILYRQAEHRTKQLHSMQHCRDSRLLVVNSQANDRTYLHIGSSRHFLSAWDNTNFNKKISDNTLELTGLNLFNVQANCNLHSHTQLTSQDSSAHVKGTYDLRYNKSHSSSPLAYSLDFNH